MGIAEAHGGTLTLVPTDKGACFRLSLPAVDTSDRLPVPALVSAHPPVSRMSRYPSYQLSAQAGIFDGAESVSRILWASASTEKGF